MRRKYWRDYKDNFPDVDTVLLFKSLFIFEIASHLIPLQSVTEDTHYTNYDERKLRLSVLIATWMWHKSLLFLPTNRLCHQELHHEFRRRLLHCENYLSEEVIIVALSYVQEDLKKCTFWYIQVLPLFISQWKNKHGM